MNITPPLPEPRESARFNYQDMNETKYIVKVEEFLGNRNGNPFFVLFIKTTDNKQPKNWDANGTTVIYNTDLKTFRLRHINNKEEYLGGLFSEMPINTTGGKRRRRSTKKARKTRRRSKK